MYKLKMTWGQLPASMQHQCAIYLSHVTHEWVMSHTNESCHVRMSHVTHEWVMASGCCIETTCRRHPFDATSMCIYLSHFTYKWVMSQANESCHMRMSQVKYEWVMSHTNESWHLDVASKRHADAPLTMQRPDPMTHLLIFYNLTTTWGQLTASRRHPDATASARLPSLVLLLHRPPRIADSSKVVCGITFESETRWQLCLGLDQHMFVYVCACVCICVWE